MCHKVFLYVVLGLAVLLGLLVTVLSYASPTGLDYMAPIARFFDTMLPILAVGALVKYLWKCSNKCECCGGTCSQCNGKRK